MLRPISEERVDLTTNSGHDRLSRLSREAYRDLKRIAQHQLAGERRHHTLQATELVHEAFVRLKASRHQTDWKHEGQFGTTHRASFARP